MVLRADARFVFGSPHGMQGYAAAGVAVPFDDVPSLHLGLGVGINLHVIGTDRWRITLQGGGDVRHQATPNGILILTGGVAYAFQSSVHDSGWLDRGARHGQMQGTIRCVTDEQRGRGP